MAKTLPASHDGAPSLGDYEISKKFLGVSGGGGSPALLSMLSTVRLEPLLRAKSQMLNQKVLTRRRKNMGAVGFTAEEVTYDKLLVDKQGIKNQHQGSKSSFFYFSSCEI